jgi:hypothetical protein
MQDGKTKNIDAKTDTKAYIDLDSELAALD